MPHQCLKCGCIYADGSPEILKGCSGCQGTRFFYTQEALGDDERSKLTDRADSDLESLALGKGVTEEPRRSRIPTKDELPVGTGGDDREPDDEWVRMTPNHLRNIVEDVVRRGTERKPRFRVGAPVKDPSQTLGEWAGIDAAAPAPRAEESDRGPDDLIESLLGDDEDPPVAPKAMDAPVEASPDDGEEEVVYARPKRPVPPPMDLTPSKGDGTPVQTPAERVAETVRKEREAREEATRADRDAPDVAPTDDPPEETAAPTRYPEGTPPETIAIHDDGAYELDVKRLLEKSPLVVHKDGSYSLHLPSLMEMVDKKPRR